MEQLLGRASNEIMYENVIASANFRTFQLMKGRSDEFSTVDSHFCLECEAPIPYIGLCQKCESGRISE